MSFPAEPNAERFAQNDSFVELQYYEDESIDLGLVLMEMLPDRLRRFAGDYGGERFGGGLLHVAEAAEVS
jgi:hypothetical protein